MSGKLVMMIGIGIVSFCLIMMLIINIVFHIKKRNLKKIIQKDYLK